MGTLWTPSGEHEPEPSRPPEAPRGPDAEEIEAIRRLHTELLATPVIDVVANHAAGLFQLALLHLGLATPPDEGGRTPAPDLAAAGVAIDALAALVDGLGSRLGEHEAPLREALAQIQAAYARVADQLDRG